jgi:hypothetical protein
VLEANRIIRHVQLKSSFRGSKVREVDIRLLRKPGGCILWLEFDRETLAIERFIGSAAKRVMDCRTWVSGYPAIQRAIARVKRIRA